MWGFVAAVVALILANADSLLGHGSASLVIRLAAGLVMVAEGLLLVLDRWRARRLLVDHLLRRFGRGRFWRVLVTPVVYVLALAFVGFGVVELVRAGQNAF
jgi:hypothetical protein